MSARDYFIQYKIHCFNTLYIYYAKFKHKINYLLCINFFCRLSGSQDDNTGLFSNYRPVSGSSSRSLERNYETDILSSPTVIPPPSMYSSDVQTLVENNAR